MKNTLKFGMKNLSLHSKFNPNLTNLGLICITKPTMERKIPAELIAWKHRPGGKPLLILTRQEALL